MPVAKSYQNLKQLSEPYEHNGKMYVTIETKSGHCKDVRWYNDKEYAKMYPDAVPEDKSKDPYYKPQKLVLGFDKGYITIFKGVKPAHEEFFERSVCRLAKWWGWYLPSTMELNEELPLGVQPVRLYWDGMGDERDWLKDEKTVLAHVRATLKAAHSPIGTSKQQGKIGDRLEIKVSIINKITDETKWGKSYVYDMKDENGNLYRWKTAAKDWLVGDNYRIRGSVKEYDEINGEEGTVLTRCLEVK